MRKETNYLLWGGNSSVSQIFFANRSRNSSRNCRNSRNNTEGGALRTCAGKTTTSTGWTLSAILKDLKQTNRNPEFFCACC